MSDYYICPHSFCHEQVQPPDDDGKSYCERCQARIEPEGVIEFDRDDIAYEKARNRGWED